MSKRKLMISGYDINKKLTKIELHEKHGKTKEHLVLKMASKLLLLLLPAIVYARISIKVKAVGSKTTQPEVEYFGSNVNIISDQEIQSFGLSDSLLKDAVQKFSGGRPGDAYLKSPTPWGDLYRSYGWSQVKRTLYPRKAQILALETKPVIVASQEFVNNSTVKATYNAGITQQVEETVSNSWTKGGELTVGQEITYSMDIKVAEVGGTTSISYAASWGEENTKSKAVTVGSSSGVQVELQPGQAVIAQLQATRGTLKIQVDYTASLDGDVACNYPKRYKGHYFWAYDLNGVQDAANLKKSIDSTEVISIGFYSDVRISVKDKDTRSTLLSELAALLR